MGLKAVFIDSWSAILHQPFPSAVVAAIGFLLGKHYSNERIEVLRQRLEARNEDLRVREGELKRSSETLSTLLKSSSTTSNAANSLREQMNLLAAKLLDFSYCFPPIGRWPNGREEDESETLQYYNRNVRRELEYLLLKFREQEGELIEEDVRVYCEYRNLEQHVQLAHTTQALHLFGRSHISETAQQLALLALRVRASVVVV